MATNKKKYHYYVLVFTDHGPVYVTKVKYREAEWKDTEKPQELDRDFAAQIALGLTWNGNSAVPVCSTWEIDQQPYYYKEYACTFVEKNLNAVDDGGKD